jgi:hypothetical protein
MRQIEPLVFSGITPARLDLIRFRAKSQGLVLDNQHGLVAWDHGIGVDYTFDPNKETLTFKVAVPFGVSDAEVEGHLSAIVRQTAPGYPQDEAHGLSAKDAVDARKNLDRNGALDAYNAKNDGPYETAPTGIGPSGGVQEPSLLRSGGSPGSAPSPLHGIEKPAEEEIARSKQSNVLDPPTVGVAR